MKKILFICPYPENVAPSQRLKFEQYYESMRQKGYRVDTRSFMSDKFWKIVYLKGRYFKKMIYTISGYLRRSADIFKLSGYDIIYIHLWVTPFGPPFFEWIYRLFAKKIIYDIDDLIYLKNVKSRSNPIAGWIKGRRKPVYLMKVADHVITCTPYLDEFVRNYNLHTTDISSTVDTDQYVPRIDYSKKDKLTIGWSGSHSTSKYLHLLDPVFRELSRTLSFKLLVMGDEHFSIDGIEVEAIPWKEEYEIETIRRFDIGVYPLPDEEWVLGKSGLKAIQYMAMGIPTIATAIGANFRVIENGVSGYLVKTEKEWIEKISLLNENADIRAQIGRAASKRVLELFSIRANAGKYLDVLEKTEQG
ncbi:MAG: glycosyltransferase family 4 protein [Chitinophagaceae bacterium]|nr:glycosyltransferase family 4 protein [Chitinophagaceae bacterium]